MQLRPAEGQPRGDVAYRKAQITVDNSAGDVPEVIGGVSLRWRLGGPRVIHPVTLAPGQKASADLRLPAGAVRQTFSVRLLDSDRADAKILAEAQAEINWSERHGRLVEPYEFINPVVYHSDEIRPASWGGESLRLFFSILAIACLAAAATLIVRRRVARILLLAIVIAAATCVVLYIAAQQETLRTRRVFGEEGTLYVVSALRTGGWNHPSAQLAPVYPDKRMMADDDMVIHPRRGVTATVRPGQVRIFRAADD